MVIIRAKVLLPFHQQPSSGGFGGPSGGECFMSEGSSDSDGEHKNDVERDTVQRAQPN